MLSRIFNSFFQSQSHYLSMNSLVAFAANEFISSNEKIARIENEFKQATDDVMFDSESKKYRMISDKTLAINCEGRSSYTLLCAAAVSNDINLAKCLIEDQGANINQGGHFPLMIAASQGNLKFIEYLLSKGADINKQTTYWIGSTREGDTTKGSTALHRAVRYGQIEAVKLLIEKGALLLADSCGDTAIDFANKILDAIKIINSKKEDATNCESIGGLLGSNELRMDDPTSNIYLRDNSKVPSPETMVQIIALLKKAYVKDASVSRAVADDEQVKLSMRR